jgi:hypothetical protein
MCVQATESGREFLKLDPGPRPEAGLCHEHTLARHSVTSTPSSRLDTLSRRLDLRFLGFSKTETQFIFSHFFHSLSIFLTLSPRVLVENRSQSFSKPSITPNHIQSLSKLSNSKNPQFKTLTPLIRMAPKKSVSEGPRKRLKSKAQREETPSIDKAFCSSDHSVRFHDDISRKTVVFGKIVDFPYFANHHIYLKELFEAQGWINFLSLRQIQYTTLVKHFYTHFEFEHNKITSM